MGVSAARAPAGRHSAAPWNNRAVGGRARSALLKVQLRGRRSQQHMCPQAVSGVPWAAGGREGGRGGSLEGRGVWRRKRGCLLLWGMEGGGKQTPAALASLRVEERRLPAGAAAPTDGPWLPVPVGRMFLYGFFSCCIVTGKIHFQNELEKF